MLTVPHAPLQCDLKYIDPSYMIRASATITTDRIYCKVDSQRPPQLALCDLCQGLARFGFCCSSAI